LALLLASIGLYGIIAHAVLRRAREIGIRVALGAKPLDIVRLILTEGMGITIVGIVLGLVAAALAARSGYLPDRPDHSPRRCVHRRSGANAPRAASGPERGVEE
jgi:hypothetical protein